MDEILGILKKDEFYARISKYTFGATTMEYLCYMINEGRVATDSKKIQVMKDWPTPKTIKQLRSFLGLCGYYRRFIKHYGLINKRMATLLKKDQF